MSNPFLEAVGTQEKPIQNTTTNDNPFLEAVNITQVSEKQNIDTSSPINIPAKEHQKSFLEGVRDAALKSGAFIQESVGGTGETFGERISGVGKKIGGGISKYVGGTIQHPSDAIVGAGMAVENFGLGVASLAAKVVGQDKAVEFLAKNKEALNELIPKNLGLASNEQKQGAYATGKFVGEMIPYWLTGGVVSKTLEGVSIPLIQKFGGSLSLKTAENIGKVTKNAGNMAGFLGTGQILHEENQGSRAEQLRNDLITYASFEGIIRLPGAIKALQDKLKKGEKITLQEGEDAISVANSELGITPLAKDEVSPKIDTLIKQEAAPIEKAAIRGEKVAIAPAGEARLGEVKQIEGIPPETKPVETIPTDITKEVKADFIPTKGKSATAQKLNQVLPDNAKLNEDYDVVTIKNELTKASDEILANKEEALRKSFDPKENPVSRVAKLQELSQIAKNSEDYSMASQLFSEINKIGTKSAQALNMFKALYEVNPEYKFMNDIVSARMGRVKISKEELANATRDEVIEKKRTAVKKNIKDKIDRIQIKTNKAQELLDRLTC